MSEPRLPVSRSRVGWGGQTVTYGVAGQLCLVVWVSCAG